MPSLWGDQPGSHRVCFSCGQDIDSADTTVGGRHHRYAARPDEPVASFNLISTIMPHAHGNRVDHYRATLAVVVAAPILAAALGYL